MGSACICTSTSISPASAARISIRCTSGFAVPITTVLTPLNSDFLKVTSAKPHRCWFCSAGAELSLFAVVFPVLSPDGELERMAESSPVSASQRLDSGHTCLFNYFCPHTSSLTITSEIILITALLVPAYFCSRLRTASASSAWHARRAPPRTYAPAASPI